MAKLINSEKERIIVVEGGKPIMVLLSFEEYSKIMKNLGSRPEDRIEIKTNEVQENAQSELKVEDLPF